MGLVSTDATLLRCQMDNEIGRSVVQDSLDGGFFPQVVIRVAWHKDVLAAALRQCCHHAGTKKARPTSNQDTPVRPEIHHFHASFTLL